MEFLFTNLLSLSLTFYKCTNENKYARNNISFLFYFFLSKLNVSKWFCTLLHFLRWKNLLWNKGDGFPILLLHGFTGNGQSWKRGILYNDLIATGYKVITPDLRGNGQSDKPTDDSSYINDAEAKDMMGLISSLGINKYNVVGYSRGSIITARLLVWITA